MRTAQLDNSRIDACRLSAGHLRRNGVGQHHPQAVLYLLQYAADLGAEDEAVAGQRCRQQARPLLSEAGKLLELPAHLRIGTVAAGSEDDTLRAPMVSPERSTTPVTRRFSTARLSTC